MLVEEMTKEEATMMVRTVTHLAEEVYLKKAEKGYASRTKKIRRST